jgi:hypothetical protein
MAESRSFVNISTQILIFFRGSSSGSIHTLNGLQLLASEDFSRVAIYLRPSRDRSLIAVRAFLREVSEKLSPPAGFVCSLRM